MNKNMLGMILGSLAFAGLATGCGETQKTAATPMQQTGAGMHSCSGSASCSANKAGGATNAAPAAGAHSCSASAAPASPANSSGGSHSCSGGSCSGSKPAPRS